MTLYETDGSSAWLDEAMRLADEILTHFADPEHGGFFYTAADHEQLIVRKKDVLDNPVPSGNGLAATLLYRLQQTCAREEYSHGGRGDAPRVLSGCGKRLPAPSSCSWQWICGRKGNRRGWVARPEARRAWPRMHADRPIVGTAVVLPPPELRQKRGWQCNCHPNIWGADC